MFITESAKSKKRNSVKTKRRTDFAGTEIGLGDPSAMTTW